MERGPLPHLLAGTLAVSSPHSPTLGPSPLSQSQLQNGQTQTSAVAVLLNPLLSCCGDSILMSRETPGPAFVGTVPTVQVGSGPQHQIQEVRAVGIVRIRGASCWAGWLFLCTVYPLGGFLTEWLHVLVRELGRAFLIKVLFLPCVTSCHTHDLN